MRIIIDPYRVYQSGKKTLSVATELDYIKSRRVILTYFITGNMEFENIYVAEHPFNTWYNDMADIILVSPRMLLQEKFSAVPLPDDLSDEDIIELNLLDAAIEPTEKEILRNFLNVVIPPKVESKNLFQFAYTLSEAVNSNKRILGNRYLSVTWKKKIVDALSGQLEGIRQVFLPIIDLNESYCQLLSRGLYGSKSNAYRKYWLEDTALEFHKLNVSQNFVDQTLFALNAVLPVNEKHENVLERFFEENLRSGVLEPINLSGYYSSELNALLAIGKKIDEAARYELVDRFKSVIDDRQRNALNKLIIPQLVRFPRLEGLSIKEQAEHLKQWSIESFIPYKFYYDEAITADSNAIEVISENAEMFGDWLFANLDAILNDDEIYTNIDIVKNIREQIKDQSSVIWLIIDGFSAQYGDLLEMVLKANGINRIQTSWSFATLPTITEVAVPITVGGKYANAISEVDLENRSELLKKAFPGKTTIYSSRPAEFQGNLIKNFDVCCLHVHEIDKEMHKNDGDFYHGRTAEIERHLKKYIEIVANIIKGSSERKINLYISTDHGATKCLTNGQMIKNQKLNELAITRPRERCIPITDELADENWERKDVYMLPRAVSRNKYDWVIARGYKYFGRNDSGYRHGGLSPEEVVVPVICGQILQLNAVKLSVRPVGLAELRFGKTERNFKVRIKNGGSNNIQILSISILEERDASFQLPLEVRASAEADIKGMIRLHQRLKSQSKNGILKLNLSIKYNSLGISYEDVLPIDILTEKDEFEIDF